MNLSHLSLYKNASRPVPTNAERIAEYRAVVPPDLTNNVFRFRMVPAKGKRKPKTAECRTTERQ